MGIEVSLATLCWAGMARGIGPPPLASLKPQSPYSGVRLRVSVFSMVGCSFIHPCWTGTACCSLLTWAETKQVRQLIIHGAIISEVAQLCPTLCDPLAYSLPGSPVHGIFQAIVLECIAISFSRGSSQPRARTRVSRAVDRRFTIWATREVSSKVALKSRCVLRSMASYN